MKKLIVSLAALCAFLLSGCVTPSSTPIISQSTAQVVDELVLPIAQGAIPLILNRNPKIEPAIETLASGLQAAFANGTVDPVGIASSVSLLNSKAKLGLTTDEVSLVANAISTGISVYEAHYGVKVQSITDPGVQAILSSISKGISNGCASWKAAHSTS